MIDMKPAPGRFVFAQPVEGHALVGGLAKILKINGTERLVVHYYSNDNKVIDKERFLFRFAYCCDTLEEAEQIRKLDQQARERYEILVEDIANQLRNLMEKSK